MRVLITGAGGYLGRGLTAAVLAGGLTHVAAHNTPLHLVLVDTDLSALPAQSDNRHNVQTTCISGSIADASVLQQVFAQPMDLVFHLAGITSRAAQDDLALGLAVNLHATLALLDALRQQSSPTSLTPARLIFASSIAVFGVPLPEAISDDTAPEPVLSYGCQKRVCELLIADFTRRGAVDGRSIRFSGVIARPPAPTFRQALSAFSSDLLQTLAAGRPYICPVSPQATNWLVSLPCAVNQLLHAAHTAAEHWPASRVVTLPALRVCIADLIAALEQQRGHKLAHRVQWQPDAELEAQFGRWPVLTTQAANRLGFVHDASVETLVSRALNLPQQASSPQTA